MPPTWLGGLALECHVGGKTHFPPPKSKLLVSIFYCHALRCLSIDDRPSLFFVMGVGIFLSWVLVSQTNSFNLLCRAVSFLKTNDRSTNNGKHAVIYQSCRKAIASQELKYRALQDELELCQANLIEAQEKLIRQEKVKRVSQFGLKRLRSGGTRKVSVAGKIAKCFECSTLTACDSTQGCCQVLSGGEPDEVVKKKWHSEIGFMVFDLQTNGEQTVFEVHLSTSGPCPSPEKIIKCVEAEAVVVW